MFFLAISLYSCRKDFTFKEFDSLSDSLHINGAVAMPLINTELTLKKYLPPNDSSLWAEVDENDLVHLKMYYEDLIVIKMTDIFNDITFPITSGFLVLKDSVTVNQSDTSSMKLYDKIFEGNLYFNDPKITFNMRNSIPLATFFRLDTLTFHDANGDELSNNENIAYNISAPTIEGETVESIIHIDKTVMPVLPVAFAPVPKSISFEYSAGSHDDQNLPFDVQGNEEMHIDVEIDLPLDVRLTTIELADTFPLPNNWIDKNVEQVKEATLKMFFSNGFPVDVHTQIYFADTLANGDVGEYIDSVFTADVNGWHLESGNISSAGKVTTPTESGLIEIKLDQARLKKLSDNHICRIVILGKLNSSNSDNDNFVMIEGDNELGIKLGIMIKYEGDTTDELPEN